MEPVQRLRNLRVLSLSARVNFPHMNKLDRITINPTVMTGRPCIRGLRVTVGNILNLLGTGRSRAEILAAYPCLDNDDLDACLQYAALRVNEEELELKPA